MFETPAIWGLFLPNFPRSFPNVSVLIDPATLTVWLFVFQLTFVINRFCLIAVFFEFHFELFHATFSFAFNELTLECQLSSFGELANFAMVETIFELFVKLQLPFLIVRKKLAVVETIFELLVRL